MAGGRGKITGQDGVPFKKNDPRINRNGRPKKLPDLDALLIDVLAEKMQGKEALKVVLIALRTKALKGDVRAIELLLDRSYGKLKVSKDIDLSFEQLSEEDLDRIMNKLLNNEKNEN
jgi:hypothetical protein